MVLALLVFGPWGECTIILFMGPQDGTVSPSLFPTSHAPAGRGSGRQGRPVIYQNWTLYLGLDVKRDLLSIEIDLCICGGIHHALWPLY